MAAVTTDPPDNPPAIRCCVLGTESSVLRTLPAPTSLLLRRRGVPDGDHTAADAAARVAGGLGLLVVGLGVHDQPAAEDRVLAVQRNQLVGEVEDRRAARIGLDVAQVADVPLVSLTPAVRLVLGVEVAAGGQAVLARQVAELVDVEAVQSGRQAGDFALDCYLVALLGEVDHAADTAARERLDDADSLGGAGHFVAVPLLVARGAAFCGRQPQHGHEHSQGEGCEPAHRHSSLKVKRYGAGVGAATCGSLTPSLRCSIRLFLFLSMPRRAVRS